MTRPCPLHSWSRASGCYCHNGARRSQPTPHDRARFTGYAGSRVLDARQEHAWEPFGPGYDDQLRPRLDGDGQIAD